MNYTAITDIRDAAIRLHLAGSQHLAYLPIVVLSAAYNGTGPEFLPLTARAAGASFQDKLNAARAYEKQVKAIQKAARKDGKNLGKLREDLVKYRDKASTVDFRDLCQGLLDMLPVPNDEN